MSGIIVRSVAVVCLLVFLSWQCLADFWLPVSLPSNPNDPYYKTFQKVPSPKVTASKLMKNFLHIYPTKVYKRQFFRQDIVVVMDGSGSIGSCEFGKGKKALKYMMRVAAGNGRDNKYAAVSFASSARVNFKFLPYSTAANQIMTIPYTGGGTNTPVGLEEAKKLFLDPSSGRRPFARRSVFLVTDGQSNNKQQTIAKARELKGLGLEIFVVGVGTYIHGIDEMVRVASHRPERHLFRVKSLGQFWEVIRLIIQQVSPSEYAVVSGQYNPPCRWG